MTAVRAFCVWACFTIAVACGGRSVDLGPSLAVNSGGATAADLAPRTVLDERVYQFLVDDTRLYWYSYLSTVKSCLKNDCEHTRVSFGAPWAMVTIGSKDVYWIPDQYQTLVVTCPNTGCVGAPRKFLEDPHAVATVAAADGDYFYWSSTFDIYRCPNKDCSGTPEVVATNEVAAAMAYAGFQFQGDYVYWEKQLANTAEGGDPSVGDAGSVGRSVPPSVAVLRAPKDGSALPQRILPPPNSSVQLGGGATGGDLSFTLDATNIYWIDASSHILSCPLAGCGGSPATPVWATDEAPKAALHVDDRGLYWLEGAYAGNLHFCAFSRCASGESVIVIDKQIFQFEINGPFVYWAEASTDGSYPPSIQRIGKPTP